MKESTCLLSRQPIYNKSMDVAAYELRTNYAADDGAGTFGSEHLRTIYEMFTEAGLDMFVGASPGLVMMTPEALQEGLWRTIPKSRVMLGYFQSFGPDDETLPLLTEIAAAGYRLALSGTLSRECLELLDQAVHTVTLDVTIYSGEELQRRVADLRKFKSKITAAGVDTYDDLQFCKDIGFDFYQGHFLFKPAAQMKSIPVNRMNMVRLLSKLHDSNIAMSEVEKIVSQDVSLSYKILQYANSASAALPRKVNSAGHAVRLIGLETIRTWSSALLLSSVDNKPRELMTSGLIRARMCELLSGAVREAEKESYLSAGLMSVLDALLDCPMEKAVGELPLADEIKDALIHRSGPIGQALSCAIAYERADWNNVRFMGLSPDVLRAHYVTSIGWARKLSGGLLN